jgi:hypothetical protein
MELSDLKRRSAIMKKMASIVPVSLKELKHCKKLLNEGNVDEALKELEKYINRGDRLQNQNIPIKVYYDEKAIFEGLADGINENGVGANIRPIDPERKIDLNEIVHKEVGILLESSDLPMDYYFGEVIRVDPPKNKDYKAYIAVKFTELPKEYKPHLRSYIGWIQEV